MQFPGAVSANEFTLVMGLIYLVAKLCIRHFLHALSDYSYDTWVVMAWCGVDLAILSISIVIGAKLPLSGGLNYGGIVLFVLFYVTMVVLAAMSYGYFVRRRKNMREIPALGDFRLSFFLTASWFCGIFSFYTMALCLLG